MKYLIILIFVLSLYNFGTDIKKYGSCGINFGEKQLSCLSQKALQYNDSTYCAKLKGEYKNWTGNNLEAGCYNGLAYLNKDPAYCSKASGDYISMYQNDCYQNIALTLKDLKVCYSSSNKDDCFFRYAISFNEGAVCNLITNKNNSTLKSIRACTEIVTNNNQKAADKFH